MVSQFARKSPLFWGFLLGLSLIVFPLVSHALFVEDVPNPRQQYGGWVTDMANILSPDTETQLNQIISELEVDTGAEIAVVTVPTTAPATSPKAFTTELFNEWGLGKAGVNNGVLFLTSVGDRRVEIETGYGVEGILPDAQVGNLINSQIIPRLRAGDWEGGILAGTQGLVSVLSGNPLEIGVSAPSIPKTFFSITAVIAWAFSWFGYNKVKSIAREPIILDPKGRSLVIGNLSNADKKEFYRWTYGSIWSASFATICLTLVLHPSGMLWRGFGVLALILGTAFLVGKIGLWLYNRMRVEVLPSTPFAESKVAALFLSLLFLGVFSAFLLPLGSSLFSGIREMIQLPPESFTENMGLFLILFGLLSALISYVITKVIVGVVRPRLNCQCKNCQTTLLPVSQDILCDRLTPAQEVAQELGSTKYEGWHCSQCFPDSSSQFHLRRYLLHEDRFSECPNCVEFTVIVTDKKILKKATETRAGLRQTNYQCQSCDYGEEKQEKIPRLSRSSDSNDNGGFGGGFGGGFDGGGGFGGGGSGGGGDFGGGGSGGGGAGGDF